MNVIKVLDVPKDIDYGFVGDVERLTDKFMFVDKQGIVLWHLLRTIKRLYAEY